MDMIDFARAGWTEGRLGTPPHQRTDDFTAYPSSPCWLAWHAGVALKENGFASPVRCRMSKGYSVRVSPAGGAEQLVSFYSGDQGLRFSGMKMLGRA